METEQDMPSMQLNLNGVSTDSGDHSMQADEVQNVVDNELGEGAMVVEDGSRIASTTSEANVSRNFAPTSVKERMIDRIANSGGHFKHQQRGEPDLTYEEKFSIAAEILEGKPSVFLTRYGKYLVEEDLVYFETMKGDYMVDYLVNDIKKELDSRKNKVKIRNRRYEAMKELISQGEYFSEDEMKYRDPLLYEQMVGQYMTDEDAEKLVDRSDLRFSTILLQHYDILGNNMICSLQKQMEDGQIEETESDDDDEPEEEMIDDDAEPKISDSDKMMLKNDFIRTMQLRFLNGEDEEFDYSKVDSNVDYDSLDIREKDEQEKYFDEEDPETASSMSSGTVSEPGKRPEAGPEDKEELDDYETFDVHTPQAESECADKLNKLELDQSATKDQMPS